MWTLIINSQNVCDAGEHDRYDVSTWEMFYLIKFVSDKKNSTFWDKN